MYRGKKIIVVMASYNEQNKIGLAVKKISKEIADEILVVDDGSKDNTAQEARDAGATIIRHKTNLGAGAGYRTGYLYGYNKKYDIIVELAGDDQDDPADIPRALDKIIDEGYDYVQGSRWMKGGRPINHPFHRSIGTRGYSFIFSILVLRLITDASNGFRAFKPEILDNPHMKLKQSWLNRYELEPYLLYKTIKLGYRVAEVPVSKFYPPNKGYTKMRPLLDWWSILRPVVLLALHIRE